MSQREFFCERLGHLPFVSTGLFLGYPQSSFHVLKGADYEKIHWSHLLAGRGRYLGYYLMDQLCRR